MNIYQSIIRLGLVTLVVCGLLACKKETDFVPENTSVALGFYPVSANTLVDLINGGGSIENQTYTANTPLAFELQYWSDAPIKEINFYQKVGTASRERLFNKPYVPSFSKIKSADTLVINYTVPQVPAATSIQLEAEIVNENTLKVIRALNIKTK
jgi:hypothetical protein